MEPLDESMPLINSSPQNNCRQSRPLQLIHRWGNIKQILSYFLRFFFWSSGYNKRLTLLSKLYSYFIFVVCWYQVVYEIAKIAGCPEFDCRNQTSLRPTQELELASYLSASVGNAFSYTLMLLCLNKIYQPYSNAISPYVGLKDMVNSKAKIILIVVLLSSATFLSYLLLFTFIVKENTYGTARLTIYLCSLCCEFLAQWVAIVSLYAFSCSAFAIGAFAADTLRRIKELNGGNIDTVIKIHKELRSIVSETTTAYSGWFLLHWLVYGVTVIVGFVVVALHKLGHDEVIRKIYFGTFFGLSVFSFVFPCALAAYVTSTCASIPAKINNTTSDDWKEGHIFKDRRQLQMFVSYCTASPVCFKIGRVTFTSTLAWFSLFFGGTGLLFHFF